MRSDEDFVGLNSRGPEKEMWVEEEWKGFKETRRPSSGYRRI